MSELPEGLEAKVVEFQGLQEQLQLVASQKMQVKMQVEEIDSALEALKTAQGKVFKSAGMLIVESDKATLSKELEEKKESLSLRLQVVAKQEEKVRKRLLELKSEIESASKGMKPQGG